MSTVLAFQLQTWNFFFRELVSGLAVGSLYALIALGYTMVYGGRRAIYERARRKRL